MEFRKLISFGKTSYVLSLPKKWVVINKLKKGDLISIHENEDELILSPKTEDIKPEQKEIIIDISGKNIKRDIRREITSAYINNFNKILITGDGINNKIEDIREILKNFIALEVVEHSSKNITARDFLNMDKISILDSIKKMDMITRSMLFDINLVSGEDNDYTHIYKRDNDVNKFSFLLFRAINFALENPKMSKLYNLPFHNLLQYWNVASSIERIADNAKRISYNFSKMSDKKMMNILIKFLSIIEKRYTDTMKSFYKNDIKLAHDIAKTKRDFMIELEESSKRNKNKWIVNDAIDKMQQMTSDIHDITRVVYLFLPTNS